MIQVEERYISLLTDFGFKRIFGTAINKDLLICFLNSLFDGKQVVKDVSYLNPEHVGDIYTDRKAIFDVYCEGENGEKFIVEMQNAYQTYFKDRSLFYSTFPIREQAALLNFDMNEEAFEKEKIRHSELREYEASKIAYRDIKNSVDTAKREGIAEGMEKGMEKKSHEIAKKMLTKGMDEATVMEITGLSAELIQQLKAEM